MPFSAEQDIVFKYLDTYLKSIDFYNDKYTSIPSEKERKIAFWMDKIDSYDDVLKKLDAKQKDLDKKERDEKFELDKERDMLDKKFKDINDKYREGEGKEIGIVYKYLREAIQGYKEKINKERSTQSGGKSRKQRGGRKGRGSSRRR